MLYFFTVLKGGGFKSLSPEFMASVCLVSFSLSIYFMLLQYIEVTISLYLCMVLFWTSCSLPSGMRNSLKTHGWPWADIIHPFWVVVSLTYSPYPFSVYCMRYWHKTKKMTNKKQTKEETDERTNKLKKGVSKDIFGVQLSFDLCRKLKLNLVHFNIKATS